MEFKIYEIDYWLEGREQLIQLTARDKETAVSILRAAKGLAVAIINVMELETL